MSKHHDDTPTYKVGVVILRNVSSRAPQVLLVRPLPKDKGDQAPFVLPRGSRQYAKQEQGKTIWLDVRDAQAARLHEKDLEPLSRTLVREAEEEADVKPEALSKRLYELGTRLYGSLSRGIYPVHWYVWLADEAYASSEHKAIDAQEIRWLSLDEMKKLAAVGDAREGYVKIVEEAIDLAQTGRLTPIALPVAA